MKPEEARRITLEALGAIAPEADFAGLDPGAELRETLDLDSMDFLNFVIGVHEATGIDIPESEYRRLSTLEGCIAYLVQRSRDPRTAQASQVAPGESS
jgi:acyl carrier protein